jgi:8-oxo-dGTP pyrophosphatase MutT (NUDIX family)
MVIRRPNGRLLTAKKTFYPTDAYRLLTGGINFGEAVLDALLREVQEETGLEVVTRRFLAAVAYYSPAYQERPVFYTFAFLLDEVGSVLAIQDPDEQVEYFREIELDELPARAAFFEHLAPGASKRLGGNWADWGQFRAVVHRLVWQALTTTD